MAYESLDWVWSPEESTPFDYTSNLATMASSIESKVGAFVYAAEGTMSPMDTANFGPYSAGNVIRCERIGKFVWLNGTWGCKTRGYLETQDSKIFGQLPVGFRPKAMVSRLQQGSNTTAWLLRIGSDGKMSASRANGTQIANYWMPLDIVFRAED